MSFDAREFLQSLFVILVSKDLLPEWVEDYEERAAILEYDGGIAREEAETQALQEINTRLRIIKKSEINCT